MWHGGGSMYLEYWHFVLDKVALILVSAIETNKYYFIGTIISVVLLLCGICMTIYQFLDKNEVIGHNWMFWMILIIVTLGLGTIVLIVCSVLSKRGKYIRPRLVYWCVLPPVGACIGIIIMFSLTDMNLKLFDMWHEDCWAPSENTWLCIQQKALFCGMIVLLLCTCFLYFLKSRTAVYIEKNENDNGNDIIKKADAAGRSGKGDYNQKDLEMMLVEKESAVSKGLYLYKTQDLQIKKHILYTSDWFVVDIAFSILTSVMLMLVICSPYLAQILDLILMLGENA